jgi:hypothetical protein
VYRLEVTFLPEASETIVVAHDWNEVLQRLNSITSPQVVHPGNPPTVLAGWIKDDRFELVVRQRRSNSFMPVVEGRIDPTRNGCIIFLRYRLMSFTRVYLILWTVIALVSGICLTIYYNNVFVGLATVLIVALLHAVAWANFKMHMRPLHDIIFKVFE